MTKPLTHRQGEILEAFLAHQELHGVPPTMREVGRMVGITRTAILHQFRFIAKKGYLYRQVGEARSYRATGKAWRWLEERCDVIGVMPIGAL